MMQEIIEKVSRIEHGFKPIEQEAKYVFEHNTGPGAFTLAHTLFVNGLYQVRSLAVFVLGYLAATDGRALHMLKTTVSHDPAWQVQEILAKAFDCYCHNVGYEQALPVIKEWLNDEHSNVCRAVTEGLRIWTTRPYFEAHPEIAIQLISQHKAHESVYLRKSVGNALRDIAKKHRALVDQEIDHWDLSDKRIQLTYNLTKKTKRRKDNYIGVTMPAVTVEVRYNYTPEQENHIIDAIHRAMMSALKTPDWDKTIRLICHDPRRFSVDIDKGERYTLVSIDLFQGRSIEAKRALYSAIVNNLQECSIPKEEVMILLREHPEENWGIRGGQAACDVDVGFKIKV